MTKFDMFETTRNSSVVWFKLVALLFITLILISQLACATTRIKRKSISSDANTISIGGHIIKVPNGYKDVATLDEPVFFEKIIKEAIEIGLKGIYNSDSGTLIFIGLTGESEDNILIKWIGSVKDLKDKDKLQKFANQHIPDKDKLFFKFNNIERIGAANHTMIKATLEAVFLETTICFGWHKDKGDVAIKNGQIVVLALYRPSVSSKAINDLFLLLN